MKINSLDVHFLVCLNHPNGLTFEEITQKLVDAQLYEHVIKYPHNLLRNSKGDRDYANSTKKDKNIRFVIENDKFFPNYDYILKNMYHLEQVYKEISGDSVLSPEVDDKGFIDLSSNPTFFTPFLSAYNWNLINTLLSESVMDLVNAMERNGLRKEDNSKIISELAGRLLPVVIARVIKYTKNPILDKYPDLLVNEILKNEFKMTKENDNGSAAWRGGKYSKRFGSFFFISWRFKKANYLGEEPRDIIKLSVRYAYLTKKEWSDHSKEGYYGNTITDKELDSVYNGVVILDNSSRGIKKLMKKLMVESVLK